MVDVVSIVIAVISLVGSAVSAAIAAFVTFYNERTKRLSESERLVAKYRDPLLLASKDLQSRLYNILDQGLLSYYDDPSRRDFIIVYTAFLVGQYFSWTHILRRQVQFLRFSTDKNNKKLSQTMDTIQQVFATDRWNHLGPDEQLFGLWRGQQMAIGELMTVTEEKELLCIGYSTFTEKFRSGEATFREWFAPVTEGVERLMEAWSQDVRLPANRLRRLQHSLVDLVDILAPYEPGSGAVKRERVLLDAKLCKCSVCTSARRAGPKSA